MKAEGRNPEMTDISDTQEPIVRPALAVEVTDRLRRMIVEGELAAGEKIREKLLTSRFGVSRTPLREALKVLAAEGYLELIPNRGAVISSQTEDELREIFPILAALEGMAGELAAQAASPEEIAEVARLTDDLGDTFARNDRPTYFEVNQAIHAAILRASRNDTLIRMHGQLAHRVQRARYRANLTPERWSKALEEHRRIASTLAERDAAALGRLMRVHLLAQLDSLLMDVIADD